MTSPEGKTDFMKETARRLAEFEEEIERNNYIEAVARIYRVGYEELRKLVSKMAIQSGLAKPAEKPKSTRNKEKEDGNLKSQRILLTWLIEDKGIFDQVRKYIKPEESSRLDIAPLSVCSLNKCTASSSPKLTLYIPSSYDTV